MVDFDVCQNAKKIIGYHSNFPLATAKLMTVCNPHSCVYLRSRADEDQSSIAIFAVLSKTMQLLPSESLGLY